MSNWSVTVLTPNGRRHLQKCGPNSTLLQILEDSCQKYGFNAEEYDLTHHNRVVDSTTILRFSGLPNNAFLEMTPAKRIRVETEVVLVLTLENGHQLHGTFKPSTTLFEILSSLLSPDELKLELNPVVIFMRRSVQGKNELKETTLKSLGLTGGRAMIRLLHRTAEQLNTQANVSAPLPLKLKEDKDEYNITKINESVLDGTNAPSNQDNKNKIVNIDDLMKSKQKETPEPVVGDENLKEKCEIKAIDHQFKSQDVDHGLYYKEFEFNENVIIVGKRNALVFSQDMSNHLPFSDLPDDFYDLSVNELKKLYVELGKRREELENAPLKTAALRNIEESEKEKAKIQQNQQVILRIIFPDRTVLQGNFTALEKIEIVREFVCSYLQDPSSSFNLYTTPPKTVLPLDATLLDVKCVPNALIYFGPSNDESPHSRQYLQSDILSKLSTPEAALFTASKLRGINKNVYQTSNTSEIIPSLNAGSGENPNTSHIIPQTSSIKDSKTPKWFKTNIK